MPASLLCSVGMPTIQQRCGQRRKVRNRYQHVTALVVNPDARFKIVGNQIVNP